MKVKEQEPEVSISDEIFEICTRKNTTYQLEDTLGYIDQVISSQKEEVEKIEKLLENLSVMILSNQNSSKLDIETRHLIQKLFGDQALVKIPKSRLHVLSKNLLALRKCMMQIEMNVGERNQFLVDHTEHEATQDLFIQALSLVDKVIMGLKRGQTKSHFNESSANKSNSEWDVKSVSYDKASFDMESKSAINSDFAQNIRVESTKIDDYTTVPSLLGKQSYLSSLNILKGMGFCWSGVEYYLYILRAI
jgi:hypothetical protein